MAIKRVERSLSGMVKFKELADYLNANKKTVEAGKAAPMAQILKILEIERPVENAADYRTTIKEAKAYESKVRYWQNKINRLIAYRGLYMSISFHNDYFFFKTKEESAQKVESLYRDSRTKMVRGVQLSHGIVNYRSAFTTAFNNQEIVAAYSGNIL
jgi:hypothetical protein